jgi:uncharacterized protein (TIGR03437 family)
VALINAGDPEVTATPTAEFTRIILQAKVQGPDGDGIPYSVSTLPGTSPTGGQLTLTALTSNLCCANVAGTQVTPENPALLGETVVIYATGIGLPTPGSGTAAAYRTGVQFPANMTVTAPANFVSSITQGISANVLQVSGVPGTFGVYEVLLQIETNLATQLQTRLTIAQNSFLSNLVVFPLYNPTEPVTVDTTAQPKPNYKKR